MLSSYATAETGVAPKITYCDAMDVFWHTDSSPTIGSDVCIAWTWLLTVLYHLVFRICREGGRKVAICSGKYAVEVPYFYKMIHHVPHLVPGSIGIPYAETETRNHQIG